MVVLAGSCSTCALNSLDPRRLTSFSADQMVLVYSSDRDTLPKYLFNLSDSIYVVADPKEDWDLRLNAVWHPRYALYGDNGQLQKLSRFEDRLSEVVEIK